MCRGRLRETVYVVILLCITTCESLLLVSRAAKETESFRLSSGDAGLMALAG